MRKKLALSTGFILVFVMLLSSCGTTRVRYLVTYPAAIELPQTQTLKLGIITWVDTTRFLEGNKKDRLILETYYYFSEALTNQLQSIDNVLMVTPTITLELPQLNRTSIDIAPDLVIKKCERIGSDYFLVIEDFKITSAKSLVLSKGEEQSKSIETSVTLTLYAKDGNRIDRSALIQVHDFPSEEKDGFLDGLISSKPSIKRNAHLLRTQSKAIVEEYVQKFKPLTTHVYRNVYCKDVFEKFVDYLNYGDFGAAEKLLIPLTENSNSKISRRAMYNMYILCEAQSKFDEAQEWLMKYNTYTE